MRPEEIDHCIIKKVKMPTGKKPIKKDLKISPIMSYPRLAAGLRPLPTLVGLWFIRQFQVEVSRGAALFAAAKNERHKSCNGSAKGHHYCERLIAIPEKASTVRPVDHGGDRRTCRSK